MDRNVTSLRLTLTSQSRSGAQGDGGQYLVSAAGELEQHCHCIVHSRRFPKNSSVEHHGRIGRENRSAARIAAALPSAPRLGRGQSRDISQRGLAPKRSFVQIGADYPKRHADLLQQFAPARRA